MKRILFFLTFLQLTVQSSFAQTYTGCVLYDNAGNPITTELIYTGDARSISSSLCGNNASYTNITYNYNNPSSSKVKTLNSYCSISPSLTITGDKKYRDCHVFTLSGVKCGILKTITVTACPIDGLEIIPLTMLAVLGIYFIRSYYKANLIITK